MACIDDLALEVETQADRLFPNRTDDTMFKKLYSELGELVESMTEDEYADVMIMLLDFGSRKMWKIEQSIRDKMAVNDKRKWIETPSGVMRHVE